MESQLDSDLSRLIYLMERREEVMFVNTSVDLSRTIQKKANQIRNSLPKPRGVSTRRPRRALRPSSDSLSTTSRLYSTFVTTPHSANPYEEKQSPISLRKTIGRGLRINNCV